MREFIENIFLPDPKLSHILIIYLQDYTVIKTVFNSLANKITNVSNSVNIAKRIADAAKMQANKTLHRVTGSDRQGVGDSCSFLLEEDALVNN